MVDRKTRRHKTRLEGAGKRQTVYDVIHRLHQLKLSSLPKESGLEDIDMDELTVILRELKQKGLIYSPKPGTFVCVD